MPLLEGANWREGWDDGMAPFKVGPGPIHRGYRDTISPVKPVDFHPLYRDKKKLHESVQLGLDPRKCLTSWQKVANDDGSESISRTHNERFEYTF